MAYMVNRPKGGASTPPKPISTVPTAKIETRVTARPVKGDVVRPTWLGYPSGKQHAFMLAEGESAPLGTVKAVCGRTLKGSRMAGGLGDRCKTCTAQFPAEIRYGKGLSEPQVEIVHTGVQHGSPREAETKIAAQVVAIGKGEAPVPTAERSHSKTIGKRAAGQRGEATIDGVALVHGASMAPVQPMWRNPKTGEITPSSRGTMSGPLGREQLDSQLRDERDRGRFTASQRKNWRRKQQRKRAEVLERENKVLQALLSLAD